MHANFDNHTQSYFNMLLYELFSYRDLNNVEATLQSWILGCEQVSLCDGRLHSF